MKYGIRPFLIFVLFSNLVCASTFECYFNWPLSGTTDLDRAIIGFIDGANTSLDISIYQLDHPGITTSIVNAAKRLGKGKVRVVTESTYYNNDKYTSYKTLEVAGITIVADDAGGSDRGLCHHKFIIRDSKAVLCGATNFTTNCINKNNNNVLIMNTASVVPIFQQEFNQMFQDKKFSTRKTASSLNHVLSVNGKRLEVYFSPCDIPRDKLLREIANAKTSIVFCIFTFTDEGIAQALIEKKKAGLDVRGVYDKLQASTTYCTYKTLSDAGVPVKQDAHKGLLHDKFMVIDGEGKNPVLLTGSFNWTDTANSANDDNLVILENKTVADAYYQQFKMNFEAGSRMDGRTMAEPKLMISKVGIAAGCVNWVEIYCHDDGNHGLGADIGGFRLEGESVVAVLPDGFSIRSSEFLVFSTENFMKTVNRSVLKLRVSDDSMAAMKNNLVLKDCQGIPVDSELIRRDILLHDYVLSRDALFMDTDSPNDWIVTVTAEPGVKVRAVSDVSRAVSRMTGPD
ncbi:MAG: phospholipase D-like domain-containing protein [Candidatus Wallbacteria bacterium]|nr:phospholipase D-like domain-containing protein [Candidatus Wallbacteria bacterium]